MAAIAEISPAVAALVAKRDAATASAVRWEDIAADATVPAEVALEAEINATLFAASARRYGNDILRAMLGL